MHAPARARPAPQESGEASAEKAENANRGRLGASMALWLPQVVGDGKPTLVTHDRPSATSSSSSIGYCGPVKGKPDGSGATAASAADFFGPRPEKPENSSSYSTRVPSANCTRVPQRLAERLAGQRDRRRVRRREPGVHDQAAHAGLPDRDAQSGHLGQGLAGGAQAVLHRLAGDQHRAVAGLRHDVAQRRARCAPVEQVEHVGEQQEQAEAARQADAVAVGQVQGQGASLLGPGAEAAGRDPGQGHGSGRGHRGRQVEPHQAASDQRPQVRTHRLTSPG